MNHIFSQSNSFYIFIFYQENLQEEHKRNQQNLADKLDARKQRRKAIAVSGVEKNSQLDLDEDRRRELNMAASGELLFGKEEGTN